MTKNRIHTFFYELNPRKNLCKIQFLRLLSGTTENKQNKQIEKYFSMRKTLKNSSAVIELILVFCSMA